MRTAADNFLQGYEADNPNIDLLRLRNYTIGRKLKDAEVVGPGALDAIVDLMGALAPFVRSAHPFLFCSSPW